MIKVFIDANILVAIVNKEYPAFDGCARVLSLANKSNFQLYCTTLSLGIVFYFAEKKFGSAKAKEKMAVLSQHIKISNCGDLENKSALANKKVEDYEDGLQYYAAINSNCQYIVSLNKKDFHFAEILVLKPLDFLFEVASKPKL